MIFRVRGMGDDLPSSDLTLDPSIDEPMYGPPLSAATLPNPTEPPPFTAPTPSASDLAAFMKAPSSSTAMPTPTAETAPLFGPPISLMTLPKAAAKTAPLLSLPSAFGIPFVGWMGIGAIGALAIYAGRGRR